ncbi:MAG: hypothetical protein ACOY94_11685 [Bacillota bacterium]
MHCTPVSFDVQSATGQEEHLSISIGERSAGEATVSYEEATATIRARVDLARLPLVVDQLDRFHYEFATELLAYVLNRGAMAQDSDGAIVYELGTQSRALRLPTNQEVGLGYPNSW